MPTYRTYISSGDAVEYMTRAAALALSGDLFVASDGEAPKLATELLGYAAGKAFGDPGVNVAFAGVQSPEPDEMAAAQQLVAALQASDHTPAALRVSADQAASEAAPGGVYGSDLSKFWRSFWPILVQLVRDIFNLD